MRKTLALIASLALTVVLTPAGVARAATGDPLAFHEVTPCVLFDTRPSQGGTGIMSAGESRTFHVVGNTSDFASQGGMAGGCGIPGFSGGQPQVEMVYLNLVAVDPTGGGNLKVWATDDPEPSGGVVNYQKLTPNLNNSNGVIVGVRQDSEGRDITVKANVSGVHVRGVALGYLTQAAQGAAAWLLEGNAGVNPATNFVGTTDDTALNFRVNNQYALRLEPADVPNVIGGWVGNGVDPGVIGAVIGGGGCPASVCGTGLGNQVTANFGAVGGGHANRAEGLRATVGGGRFNNATAADSTVAGGHNNHADGAQATVAGGATNFAVGDDSFIGGGNSNEANAAGAIVVGGGGNVADSAYSFIGGGVGNQATDGSAVIGGGTDNVASNTNATVGGGFTNTASGPQATVAGGRLNQATLSESTVGGGFQNTASGARSTVSGGNANLAGGVSAPNSTVAGGSLNQATGSGAAVGGGMANQASASAATVAGGRDNIASANDSTVGGGRDNDATALNATVGGGELNVASGLHSTVGGGSANQAMSDSATVAGGMSNVAAGAATVGGGQSNQANGSHSAVLGGAGNVAGGFTATIGGGDSHRAAGIAATVPGGSANSAAGDYSFAAGRNAKVDALHDGTFLWSDAGTDNFNSESANEFAARATGGVRFVSAVDGNGNPSAGVVLAPGSGSWASLSDEGAKDGVAPVNPRSVLEGVAGLDITAWSYRGEDPSVVHLGPTAQDFHATFGLGPDDRYITSVDADGVALAAIQGLNEKVEQKDARLAELESRLASVEGGRPSSGGLPPTAMWGAAAALGLVGLGVGRRWGRSAAPAM